MAVAFRGTQDRDGITVIILCQLNRVAVALRGDRGPQHLVLAHTEKANAARVTVDRNHSAMHAAWSVSRWRSSSGATEDRNSSPSRSGGSTPPKVAVALRGGRDQRRGRYLGQAEVGTQAHEQGRVTPADEGSSRERVAGLPWVLANRTGR